MKLAKESIDRFFDYGLHLETRTVYIGDHVGGAVDSHAAERAVKALYLLTAASKEQPIKILLNSQGGCWYSGMAIFDAIAGCPCPVTAEAYGSAMSMGAIILQAADERLMQPNATLMVHDGSEVFQGQARNFEAWGEQSKNLRNRMYEIYAKRSGQTVQYWKRKCASDFILTAEEAVAEGLADKIVGGKDE